MLVGMIIEAATAEFKRMFAEFCTNEPMERLTLGLAKRIGEGVKCSLAGAGVAAYREFLLSFDVDQDMVAADGEYVRFKEVRMKLPRRVYLNKSDDKSHAPLDAGWGMEGQYMVPLVRETVLFSCGHVTPEDTAAVLRKSALFQAHPTAIKHVVEKTDAAIEANRDALRPRGGNSRGGHACIADESGRCHSALNLKGAAMSRPAERPRG